MFSEMKISDYKINLSEAVFVETSFESGIVICRAN